jgi:hypothetical protein
VVVAVSAFFTTGVVVSFAILKNNNIGKCQRRREGKKERRREQSEEGST